jgi:hypothetical protein
MAEHMGLVMALYFFRISHGSYSSASDQPSEFDSRDLAFAEMTKVCGDFVAGIARNLQQGAGWQMELLDEVKQPVFKIRLVAETIS